MEQTDLDQLMSVILVIESAVAETSIKDSGWRATHLTQPLAGIWGKYSPNEAELPKEVQALRHLRRVK